MKAFIIVFVLCCLLSGHFADWLLYLLLPIAILSAVFYFFKQFFHSIKIIRKFKKHEQFQIEDLEDFEFDPDPQPAETETQDNDAYDVVFKLEDIIDGATVAYTYEEVSFVFSYAEDPDPFIAQAIDFYKQADKIYVLCSGVQLGHLKPGKITDMVSDWLDRGDPIRAFLTAYDQDECSGEFTIVFYRDALKHAMRRSKSSKEIKLTGNKAADVQELCHYANVGDRCSIEYDYDKEKYAVYDDTYTLYGYLSAAGAKFYEENGGDCLAVVSNVELDDEDRTVIYVTLYAQ